MVFLNLIDKRARRRQRLSSAIIRNRAIDRRRRRVGFFSLPFMPLSMAENYVAISTRNSLMFGVFFHDRFSTKRREEGKKNAGNIDYFWRIYLFARSVSSLQLAGKQELIAGNDIFGLVM